MIYNDVGILICTCAYSDSQSCYKYITSEQLIVKMHILAAAVVMGKSRRSSTEVVLLLSHSVLDHSLFPSSYYSDMFIPNTG